MNTAIALGLVVGITGLLVALVMLRGIARSISAPATPPQQPAAQPTDTSVSDLARAVLAVNDRLDLLKREVDQLPTIWKDERVRMERHANRIEQAERRAVARAAAEGDDGDFTEADDVGAGAAAGMHTVRPSVEAQPAAPHGGDRLAEARRALNLQRLQRRA